MATMNVFSNTLARPFTVKGEPTLSPGLGEKTIIFFPPYSWLSVVWGDTDKLGSGVFSIIKSSSTEEIELLRLLKNQPIDAAIRITVPIITRNLLNMLIVAQNITKLTKFQTKIPFRGFLDR